MFRFFVLTASVMAMISATSGAASARTVKAPYTRVTYGDHVRVKAPYTKVSVTSNRVRVHAPYVNLNIGW